MATANTIIWILIILLVLFGIDYFIRPPKYYGISVAAFGVAVELFIIYLVLNDML